MAIAYLSSIFKYFLTTGAKEFFNGWTYPEVALRRMLDRDVRLTVTVPEPTIDNFLMFDSHVKIFARTALRQYQSNCL